jgi:hypothetical protein
MSKNEKDVTTVAATGPAINYAEAAQERVQELHRWREQIPQFTIPTTSNAPQRLSSAAGVSPEFVELTSMALANHRVLVRAEGATPTQVRDLVAYADAFGPLADELEALAHFVRYSAKAARHAAGSEALTTYSLATRLSKLPANAHLRPHVADMRRALGRGRKASPDVVARKAAERADRAAERAAKAAARAGRVALPAPELTPQE